MPGEPCQLAECMWELREAMEPLAMFMDKEVFSNNAPSHCVKITSSRTSEPMEPAISWEWSHSRNRRAYAQGSFAVAHGIGQSKPTTTTSVASSLTTSSQRAETLLESNHHPTANAPARFCRDCEVPVGGQSTTCDPRSPIRANHTTRPLGGDSNGYDCLYMTMPGCGVRHHLPRHGDHLHEPFGLGSYPLGSWLPYTHTGGVERMGVWPSSSHPLIASFCWQLLTLNPCWTVFS